MKKILVFFAAIVVLTCVISSCKKTTAIPLKINVPTDTPTPRSFAIGPLLDDMEDGDNASYWGGYWYTYDDGANGGTSYAVPMSDTWANSHSITTAPFYMQHPGCDTSGNNVATGFSARMTGLVTNTYTYGFVGMGNTFLNPQGPVSLTYVHGWKGVSFWVKGDGKTYKMKIGSVNPMFLLSVNDNFYEWSFTASSTWTKITVPFTSMTQEPYWGTVLPVTSVADCLDMAVNIQWQCQGADVIGNNATVDLALDNVTFY